MATPNYQGGGQPPMSSGGWFGALGSWFGTETPAYAGKGQPSSGSAGYLARSSPGYKPAPAVAQPATPVAVKCQDYAPGVIAIEIPRELIEQ